MVTLFGFPGSRSFRVSWMLEELGIQWQYHYVDLYKGEHKSAKYLAINPSGKVPTIKDDDVVLSESAAICHFLAEKYGSSAFLPALGSAESATYFQWLVFITAELEQPLWTMGKHKFALPEEKRCVEIMPTAVWEFEQVITTAELRLGDNEFAIGTQFTAVDVLLTQTLNWAKNFEQTIPPKLEVYRKRLSERRAFISAKEKEVTPS